MVVDFVRSAALVWPNSACLTGAVSFRVNPHASFPVRERLKATTPAALQRSDLYLGRLSRLFFAAPCLVARSRPGQRPSGARRPHIRDARCVRNPSRRPTFANHSRNTAGVDQRVPPQHCPYAWMGIFNPRTTSCGMNATLLETRL